MKFRPLHDYVLIKRIDAAEERVGGIIIPETARGWQAAARGRSRWQQGAVWEIRRHGNHH